jgi:hypothetical protein
LYKEHLMILKGLIIMMSPFKINKCCLHNDESLQDQQMLFVQWRVPSR